MSLQDLDIKDTYTSSVKANDLVHEFYNPVIGQALNYDRITGFFSPAVLAIASRGFAELISTGGKIRLLTSVQLDDRIYQSVIENNSSLDDKLLDEFDFDTIKSELDKDYLSVFAWLYRTGQLEMKVAVMSKDRSMLHQKIGIVTDSDGNSVSFSGSNNETPNGWQHNIEQFKVFKSWNPYTESFFRSDKEEFDILWDNLSTKASVVTLDEAIKDKLIRKIEKQGKDDINTIVKRIRKREHINKIRILPAKGRDITVQNEGNKNSDKVVNTPEAAAPRTLFDYQVEAIQYWVNSEYHSIFEMATGTGKTFTSIHALKRFKEENGYLRAVVVVPLTTLTIQWQNDIRDVIHDCQIINTSISNDWRSSLQSIYLSSKMGHATDYIIVTTYKMFPKADFVDLLEKLDKRHVLVADEMHNLVTERGIGAASSSAYKYRLGLSATPTRLWKPRESEEVARLFGNSRYTYELATAIKNKFLVPFYYHPVLITLDVDEYEEYTKLSKQISRMFAASDPKAKNDALNNKLIARARIKKNASAKLPALDSLVRSMQSNDEMHHALIYVDNEVFLESLQIMLTRNNILTTKFLGSTPLDQRLSIMSSLRTRGISAIVAIKCLDEGVDIPSAQKAFFLSNNTDPREYVQRLGRVLRVDRAGDKQFGDVYDYLVLPPKISSYSDETERAIARSLIRGELIRAKFFQDLASNGNESKGLIMEIVDEYGFYFDEDELKYDREDDN